METPDGDPHGDPQQRLPTETPKRDPDGPLTYHQDPRKIPHRLTTNCQWTPANRHPTNIQRTPIVMQKSTPSSLLSLKLYLRGHAIIGDFNEGGRKLHKSQKVVNLFGIVFDLATLKQHTDPQITETVYIRADTGQVFLHMRYCLTHLTQI